MYVSTDVHACGEVLFGDALMLLVRLYISRPSAAAAAGAWSGVPGVAS